MRVAALIFALAIYAPLALPIPAQAQWTIQTPTTADLRGIDNVGKGVAWASGTNGTVLRTEDAGYLWQACTIPPNAEHLDFRGIQAFDANTAIVMSSGPGDQSRLYKTTDGCQTWTLLFTNPDKTGFWDALIFVDKHTGWLLGDPVDGSFVFRKVDPSGSEPMISSVPPPASGKDGISSKELQSYGRGVFAASNSSIALRPNRRPFNKCNHSQLWFGTSGPGGPKVFRFDLDFHPACGDAATYRWVSADVPMAGSNASSGIFSLGAEDDYRLVAVGGDYLKPDLRRGTAAFSEDGGKTWQAAATQPHGYRSAVAYDASTKTWITAGPNGTDISTDDGRNWRALQPSPGEAPDAAQHWNALSLPYAVGPHGRIGLLNPDALKPTSTKIPPYEVVSIRPATDHIEFRGADDATDGTHIIHTLKGLVSYAYGVRPEFVSCAIKWCDSVMFDLRAKVADSDIADLQTLTSEQRGLMLKPTLAERFGLKLHSETRPLRVYDLVIAKSGTKLHLHPPNATPQTAFANGRPPDGVMMFRGSEIKGYAVTLSALAKTLSGIFSESVERPVIDKTGLQGTYDFDLKWTPEQTASQSPDAASNGSQQEAPQEDSAPSIFTALQEQLGLKLQPATAPTLMIVVDAAHMPSQN